MTSNPYDPNKVGQYNDWRNHAEKYGTFGAGAGSTHVRGFAQSSSSSNVPSLNWSQSSPVSGASSGRFPVITIECLVLQYLLFAKLCHSSPIVGGFCSAYWGLYRVFGMTNDDLITCLSVITISVIYHVLCRSSKIFNWSTCALAVGFFAYWVYNSVDTSAELTGFYVFAGLGSLVIIADHGYAGA